MFVVTLDTLRSNIHTGKVPSRDCRTRCTTTLREFPPSGGSLSEGPSKASDATCFNRG